MDDRAPLPVALGQIHQGRQPPVVIAVGVLQDLRGQPHLLAGGLQGLAASAGARWARLERWSLMRAVIQRVNRAAVRVDGEVVGEITRPGLMVLVGATHDDGPTQVATVARKIADLRLLEGELSVTDAGAPVLVVSQFTLYADTRKGRRPTWNKAAPGEVAEPLVEAVAEDLRGRGLEVATGRFGADMKIDMEADGPVTILIEAE